MVDPHFDIQTESPTDVTFAKQNIPNYDGHDNQKESKTSEPLLRHDGTLSCFSKPIEKIIFMMAVSQSAAGTKTRNSVLHSVSASHSGLVNRDRFLLFFRWKQKSVMEVYPPRITVLRCRLHLIPGHSPWEVLRTEHRPLVAHLHRSRSIFPWR